ncbi:unnamed protein product [Thelazia callipaeda]|uniref:Secreted protein n=1 Tax=Thelazia callipaeda TaxID=103827 RepID=A0A0N5CLH0_THECL|nr:unnamed protein product [Thelazia callipaeda]
MSFCMYCCCCFCCAGLLCRWIAKSHLKCLNPSKLWSNAIATDGSFPARDRQVLADAWIHPNVLLFFLSAQLMSEVEKCGKDLNLFVCLSERTNVNRACGSAKVNEKLVLESQSSKSKYGFIHSSVKCINAMGKDSTNSSKLKPSFQRRKSN